MASKKLNLIVVCLIASAFVAAGCGSKSSNPTAPAPTPDPTPPSPVSGLSASYSPETRTVTVTWGPSPDATQYVVERSQSGPERGPVEIARSAELSYSQPVNTYNVTLTYHIYAEDEYGNVSTEQSETVVIPRSTGSEPDLPPDVIEDPHYAFQN